jgi:UDP-N-acetylglucosamine 2-epimerase (non-hydrolysing)
MIHMSIQKILIAVGTRPEAIKMAPLILGLQNENWVNLRVLNTGQHREMVDEVFKFFGIVPDIDLNLMTHNQSLTRLTTQILSEADRVLSFENPNVVLVQGDTTTSMVMALASFYRQIPVGHVEAGLRTWDISNPFPEEANRRIISQIATWHFAPTQQTFNNLVKEGITTKNILLSGNTVIDALMLASNAEIDDDLGIALGKKIVLITCHRRENFGDPLDDIFQGLRRLSLNNPDVTFLYPVHPNPNVKNVAEQKLGDIFNLMLIPPLSYSKFISIMRRSHLIISDSGGIQEEAPALNIPLLVLRNESERPEALETGAVKLVGTNADNIFSTTQKLLDHPEEYLKMINKGSPYGDGHAAEKIIQYLAKELRC